DPNTKNPNPVPPPKGLDDVIKPKRATRSTNIDVKLVPKYMFSISKPTLGGGRKSYKKGRSMGRDLKKCLEDMEYNDASSDGSDDRNDVEGVTNVNSDGNMVYDNAGRFVNQGIKDNRGSEGVNIEGSCGFNSTDSLYKDSELEDEVSSVSKSNVVKNVEKSVKLSANDENVVGDMPVPFNENVILNPGGNVVNDTSNEVRRNKVNGVVRNMVWPSLNEINRKDMGRNVVGVKATNTDMFDSTSGTKSMSFISTFQGMSASGNNKLSRIHVRVNNEGNKVVDMDPLLSVKGMNFVLENRPWLVEGKPLFVQNGKPSYGITSGVEESLNGEGGWQDVTKTNRSGASISNNVDQRYNNRYGFGYRGGYNVRGRGSRGGMNGRGGLSGGRGSVYQRENNEGVVGNRANKGKNVDNTKSGSVKKTNEKTWVTVKNSFDALVDESVEIGGDEWVQMRGKIDLATELAKARQNLIDGLKWRIAKLKQDIVHGNTYMSKVANEEADKHMDEEVAEDTSDSAKFMTRDEVQNMMEDKDILLQGNFASTSSVV
ncbi:hypothetical protein Tco_1309093, partial [Tanacetum coccineum]